MTAQTEVLRDEKIGDRLDEMIKRAKQSCQMATWNLGSAQDGPLSTLLELEDPPKVTVVVNAKLGAAYIDVLALKRIRTRLGKESVLRHKTSHAKIFIIDGKEAIVGSANLSATAMTDGENFREVAIWTRQQQLVAAVVEAYTAICDSAHTISERDLDAILAYQTQMRRAIRTQHLEKDCAALLRAH